MYENYGMPSKTLVSIYLNLNASKVNKVKSNKNIIVWKYKY